MILVLHFTRSITFMSISWMIFFQYVTNSATNPKFSFLFYIHVLGVFQLLCFSICSCVPRKMKESCASPIHVRWSWVGFHRTWFTGQSVRTSRELLSRQSEATLVGNSLQIQETGWMLEEEWCQYCKPLVIAWLRFTFTVFVTVKGLKIKGFQSQLFWKLTSVSDRV